MAKKSFSEAISQAILSTFIDIWVLQLGNVFQSPNEPLNPDDRDEFFRNNNLGLSEASINIEYTEEASLSVGVSGMGRQSLHITEGSVGFALYGALGTGPDQLQRESEMIINKFYEKSKGRGVAALEKDFSEITPNPGSYLIILDEEDEKENDQIYKFFSNAPLDASLGYSPSHPVKTIPNATGHIDLIDKLVMKIDSENNNLICAERDKETNNLKLCSKKQGFTGNDIWFWDPGDEYPVPKSNLGPMNRLLGGFGADKRYPHGAWITSVIRANAEAGRRADIESPFLVGRYLTSVVVAYQYEEFR